MAREAAGVEPIASFVQRLGVLLALMLPLGVCVLPAFMLLGVAPLLIAVVSSTVAGFRAAASSRPQPRPARRFPPTGALGSRVPPDVGRLAWPAQVGNRHEGTGA